MKTLLIFFDVHTIVNLTFAGNNNNNNLFKKLG